MAERYMPLYVPMKADPLPEEDCVSDSERKPEYDFLMCMWKVKNPLYPEPDFCNHPSKDFSSLIQHLTEDHQAVLEKNVDFCPSCQIVFDGPLQGIHHYLSKALNFEDFEMANENPANKDVDLKLWLGPIFDTIKTIRDGVMNKIIYQQMPPLEGFPDDMLDDPETPMFDDNALINELDLSLSMLQDVEGTGHE